MELSGLQILLLLFAVPVLLYVTVRFAATAWFNAKADFYKLMKKGQDRGDQ